MAFCFQNINRSPYSVSCNRHRLIILKSEINLELFSSVQFSPSVVSDSLQPHEPQHARPPYISPNPRVHSNPCPSSRWCHPTISSPVVPFSSCPQSFPASGSFQMSQLFASGSQSIGVSACWSWSLLRLMSIELVMPSNHLMFCNPLLLLHPIPLSIRVFPNESTLSMRWPKYCSFSFSIIPSKEHPGLIFRMDWLDLLAVQGTLNSLLQHHSSKASILWRSAFFTVQLSHPYMTTGKIIALTRRTFVGKVMSLLLNMLSKWSQKFTKLFNSFFPSKGIFLTWSHLRWFLW